jgi:hypothetical protein
LRRSLLALLRRPPSSGTARSRCSTRSSSLTGSSFSPVPLFRLCSLACETDASLTLSIPSNHTAVRSPAASSAPAAVSGLKPSRFSLQSTSTRCMSSLCVPSWFPLPFDKTLMLKARCRPTKRTTSVPLRRARVTSGKRRMSSSAGRRGRRQSIPVTGTSSFPSSLLPS